MGSSSSLLACLSMMGLLKHMMLHGEDPRLNERIRSVLGARDRHLVHFFTMRRSKRTTALAPRRSARKRARQDQDSKVYGQDYGILPSD